MAIIGLGAVGASYAKYIVKNAPEINLFGVVRDLDHFWGAPILINDIPLRANYRTISTLKSIPLHLILICVKSYQMKEALIKVADIVGEDTIVMSLTSGLAGEDLLRDTFGERRVIRATIVGANITRNERYVTLSQIGTLYYGSEGDEASLQADAVQKFFNQCKIPNRRVDNIAYYLWRQLMIDASINQISTVYQLTYGKFLKSKKAIEIMHTAQTEVISVADSCGVKLNKSDIYLWEKLLQAFPSDSCSTMLQDYWTNRKLEIDAFGDYICLLASEKNITIPANRWLRDELHNLIRQRAEIPIKDSVIRSLSSRKNLQVTPERIANQLRADIIMAKLNSSEKLSENDLAKRFDVSRNSVRTALQMLANEGLLRLLSNGRREILEFGDRQVEDLFDTRWLLENKALELLLANKQSVYPLLAQSLLKIEHKYRTHSDSSEWPDLDIEFHRSLILSTENTFLLSAWESGVQLLYAMMCFNSSTYHTSHFGTEFFGKHRYIYEMILSGNRAVLPELKRHIEEDKISAAATVKRFRSSGC